MARWDRIIVHADMDAFFASIEQLDQPALRGKPILVARDEPRSVVTTASYEARPYGVGSAMPLAAAKRRCPDAIVVPPRFRRYQEVSSLVMEAFHAFTPKVEPLSLDEAFLDMSGSGHIFGTPKAMGARIQDAVREATSGLTVSVGIATTKFVAKVASDFRKPGGLTIVPREKVKDFLDPLPLSKLWGVGPKTEERLKSLGLRTIGDVGQASPSLLRSKVGSMAVSLCRLSHGIDPREVDPHRETKSVSAEVTLDTDIIGGAAFQPHLQRAVDRVAGRLRHERLLAKGVRLKWKTADFRLQSRQTTLRVATSSTKPILSAAMSLLPFVPDDVPIRLVGVATFGLIGDRATEQFELFSDEREREDRRLEETVDEVRGRYGPNALKRASDFE